MPASRTQLRHERFDHTLETRALINEAYLRLVDGEAATVWQAIPTTAAFSGLSVRGPTVNLWQPETSTHSRRVDLELPRARFEER